MIKGYFGVIDENKSLLGDMSEKLIDKTFSLEEGKSRQRDHDDYNMSDLKYYFNKLSSAIIYRNDDDMVPYYKEEVDTILLNLGKDVADTTENKSVLNENKEPEDLLHSAIKQTEKITRTGMLREQIEQMKVIKQKDEKRKENKSLEGREE